MTNRPKAKGTKGETELRILLEEQGLSFRRTAPTFEWDLDNAEPGFLELYPLEVLATRPDNGEWLMTMRLENFVDLLTAHRELTGNLYNVQHVWETHIEVKRYKKFAHHTLFEEKFG